MEEIYNEDMQKLRMKREELHRERSDCRVRIDYIDAELLRVETHISNLRYELNKREEEK
jgi:chromosome condensin MukBEF ATPase and DNA-binding subunit MukB